MRELHQLGTKEKWNERVPEGGVENNEVKLLWDMKIRCDTVVEARGPNIIAVSKKESKCISCGHCMNRPEFEKKKEKHQGLKKEIKRMWRVKSVE